MRNCALTVLERVTSDPQCQRVFEIACHKVEYVDEMAPLRARNVEGRAECVAQIERGLREAAKRGLLHESVNPRLAAIALHAPVDGLITNRVLDAKYLPLAKAARRIIDSYLNGLRRGGGRVRATSRRPAPVSALRKRTARAQRPRLLQIRAS